LPLRLPTASSANSENPRRGDAPSGSILDEARVARGAIIGPYSHLRPAATSAKAPTWETSWNQKIRLGKGSKANHLTYLGDADDWSGVNLGAGTITCNYDGVHKHKTVIGEACSSAATAHWSRL